MGNFRSKEDGSQSFCSCKDVQTVNEQAHGAPPMTPPTEEAKEKEFIQELVDAELKAAKDKPEEHLSESEGGLPSASTAVQEASDQGVVSPLKKLAGEKVKANSDVGEMGTKDETSEGREDEEKPADSQTDEAEAKSEVESKNPDDAPGDKSDKDTEDRKAGEGAESDDAQNDESQEGEEPGDAEKDDTEGSGDEDDGKSQEENFEEPEGGSGEPGDVAEDN